MQFFRQIHLYMKLDRTMLVMENHHKEAERSDKQYWDAKSPMERFCAIQTHRQAAYGNEATRRLQRILEVAERQ